MTKRVLLGFAIAAAVVAAWFAISGRGNTGPVERPTTIERVSPPDGAVVAIAEVPAGAAVDDDPIARAERNVTAARRDHERALAAIANAERALLESEREIEKLEDYVADLEARGEDPARHAFEGMDLFNPVLDRFLPRVEALEQAERDEASSRAALEAEEARLAALRAGAAPSPRQPGRDHP